MSALTIPAAVWACRVDGVPLVAGIMEGECPIGCAYDGTGRGKHGMFCSAAGSKPTADLVALRDARCETCGGRSEVLAGGRMGPLVLRPCPNPRCVDGRLLVDVRVECIDVHKYNERSARARLERRRKQGDELFMVEHDGDWYTGSYRTVKGLVDVVRIDEVYDGFDPSGATALLSSEVDTSSVFAVLTPAHVEALGTIQPGQWAWTFTEA